MSFFKFNQSNPPKLDENTSAQMLENIFDACYVQRNSVPLSVLTSYSNYRKERFLLQRLLLVLIILCFCSMPLLFVLPKMQLSHNRDISSFSKQVYELNVRSLIPIKKVTATINGKQLAAYETASKTYSIESSQNGTLLVTVTLKNGQSASQSHEVTGIDTQPPSLVSSETKNRQIYIYLSDDASGIDYDGITAMDRNGQAVLPASLEKKEEGCIIFDYPATDLNIYVPDKAENVLHLVLTPK